MRRGPSGHRTCPVRTPCVFPGYNNSRAGSGAPLSFDHRRRSPVGRVWAPRSRAGSTSPRGTASQSRSRRGSRRPPYKQPCTLMTSPSPMHRRCPRGTRGARRRRSNGQPGRAPSPHKRSPRRSRSSWRSCPRHTCPPARRLGVVGGSTSCWVPRRAAAGPCPARPDTSKRVRTAPTKDQASTGAPQPAALAPSAGSIVRASGCTTLGPLPSSGE